ncbi:hypothetical protein JaAD80_07080 [Janthinobacterium sp. AD80]|nr:hypothetical protein JaAD80_07080 [Janthinobacterium sp. AD80]
MVMIFSCPVWISVSAAYNVVVLPLPVGPVTSSMPCGFFARRRMRSIASASRPRLASEMA